MSCGWAPSRPPAPPPKWRLRPISAHSILGDEAVAFAVQFLIDVLSLGGAYALMALGLVLVFGILRLVNFAYGELIMVAGYTMFLVGGSGLPWLVMAAVAVLMAMAAAVATDYVAFRPVRAKSVTAVLITSFAF